MVLAANVEDKNATDNQIRVYSYSEPLIRLKIAWIKIEKGRNKIISNDPTNFVKIFTKNDYSLKNSQKAATVAIITNLHMLSSWNTGWISLSWLTTIFVFK